MMAVWRTGLCLSILALLLSPGEAIQCYQCDSNEDSTCQADQYFDHYINAVVDCNSFEANVPGQFCMKIVQESPGWGGWKKITRRCGSRTDFGVAWGCRWSWDANGVFRETCYCEDRDGCNGSSRLSAALAIPATVLSIIMVLKTYLSH